MSNLIEVLIKEIICGINLRFESGEYTLEKENETIKKIIFSFVIVLFIFFLDRITKILILNIAEEVGKVNIYVNSFLN